MVGGGGRWVCHVCLYVPEHFKDGGAVLNRILLGDFGLFEGHLPSRRQPGEAWEEERAGRGRKRANISRSGYSDMHASTKGAMTVAGIGVLRWNMYAVKA
jgi:predicted secreted protein